MWHRINELHGQRWPIDMQKNDESQQIDDMQANKWKWGVLHFGKFIRRLQ